MVGNIWSGLGELNWVLSDSHIASVPFLGEFIAIVDKAGSSINHNAVSALKISWAVEFLLLE